MGSSSQRDFMPFKKRPRFSNIDYGVMYSDLRPINTIKPNKTDTQLRAMGSVEFVPCQLESIGRDACLLDGGLVQSESENSNSYCRKGSNNGGNFIQMVNGPSAKSQ